MAKGISIRSMLAERDDELTKLGHKVFLLENQYIELTVRLNEAYNKRIASQP